MIDEKIFASAGAARLHQHAVEIAVRPVRTFEFHGAVPPERPVEIEALLFADGLDPVLEEFAQRLHAVEAYQREDIVAERREQLSLPPLLRDIGHGGRLA